MQNPQIIKYARNKICFGVFAKKLWHNLNNVLKPFLQLCFCPKPSFFAQLKWKDTFIASSFHKNNYIKKGFLFYYKKKSQKDAMLEKILQY